MGTGLSARSCPIPNLALALATPLGISWREGGVKILNHKTEVKCALVVFHGL